ncbi:persephin, partial [Dryobates pubescens]|uniref:persephin n=1 Tax=Dryobates pubescens TaxID=118200 RepID=UPI0023B8D3C9
PPPSPRGGPRCQLRSRTLRVRELGLGYPSEELVRFSYCWGGCPSPPTNHGLVLARLGARGAPGGGPCCRPSRYEDVAFLDEGQRWHRLRQLSAAACRCLG